MQKQEQLLMGGRQLQLLLPKLRAVAVARPKLSRSGVDVVVGEGGGAFSRKTNLFSFQTSAFSNSCDNQTVARF